MRWQGGQQSENFEDRRGMGGQVMVGGGIGTLFLLLVVWLLGGDPLAFLQQINQAPPPGQAGPMMPGGQPAGPEINDKAREFVSVVLKDTEDVWHQQFGLLGKQYRDPHLVLFADATQSGCGFAQSATGPFYCPEDERVYLDLSFYDELKQRFGAPGEFAQAYVLAHEIGHHVQKILGIEQKVERAMGADPRQA